MDDRSPLPVGERFLNPLRMKHHLRSGNQKKKTRFAGLFFLTGLRPVLPPRYAALAAIVSTEHTTKHSEMQPRHVQCLHRIRMTYPLEIRKYNRSESSDKNHRKKSWKSVNGKPFPAIATCFWKIERAVWSSGNIPFTVLTSFNFKVVIAERITMESQKKKIWWTSQQGTENSIFRVIFRIRFEVITTMISFKHHLTGEAWPACRAILPFHHTQNVWKLQRKKFSPNIHASVWPGFNWAICLSA